MYFKYIKIASDIVNIYDDASLKDGFGHYAYDVEGVKTKKNQLVKNGELVSLLNSRETASKLGMKSSGNARSPLSDQPIVRMSNTYLEPGDMSFDELIEDINDFWQQPYNKHDLLNSWIKALQKTFNNNNELKDINIEEIIRKDFI